MIENTLLNVVILELKIYCVLDKFYGRSNFGHYDEVKNRAPLLSTDLWWLLGRFIIVKIYDAFGFTLLSTEG